MRDFNRPDRIDGTTYKIKPPVRDAAIYITINNAEIDGQLRPVELFINSKDMPHLAWSNSVSRIVSGVLQAPGPFQAWVLDELLQSFDVDGGYIIPGSKGQRANSVVAHIGMVLMTHCRGLGLLAPPTVDFDNG